MNSLEIFMDKATDLISKAKLMDILFSAGRGMAAEDCINHWKEVQDRWYNPLDFDVILLHVHERGLDFSVNCYRGQHKGGNIGRFNYKWQEIIDRAISHYDKQNMRLSWIS